jgi:alpha-L-rhamnosidase
MRSTGDAGTVVDLRTEYERDPVAVAPDAPRFSWRVADAPSGARQTAYRVLVGRTRADVADGRGTIWDSGRVESDRSTNVTYDGTPLDGDTTYHWTVHVWNGDGDRLVADPATFATALADGSDWTGEWIGHQPGPGDSNGYRSRWSRDATGEWVQVDLGEPRDIAAVELHPASPFDAPVTPDGARVRSRPGFGFPDGYRIAAADDPAFDDARTVAERTDEPESDATGDPVVVDTDSDTVGRYVRVTATAPYTFAPDADAGYKPTFLPEDHRPWSVLALAALAVRDGAGGDLAAGAPVSASSSYEAAAWGRDRLVDGVYESAAAATAPRLRTEFDLGVDGATIDSARLHVCGLV